MIIEFIGVPGSGKTYISNNLYKYFNKNADYNVVYNDEILQEINKDGRLKHIMILIKYIWSLYFWLIIYDIVSNKISFKTKKLLIKIFIRRILTYRKVEELKRVNQDVVCILDEGFLHLGIAIFRHKRITTIDKKLENYLNCLDKLINYNLINKYFVFVDSDIKENYKRIERRTSGWPRTIKEYSRKEKENYLSNSYKCYEKIKKCAHLNNQTYIINNDKFKSDYSSDFKFIYNNIKKV